MKTLVFSAVLGSLIALCGCQRPSSPAGSLAPVVKKARTDGKEATLNVGFARFLGLQAEQPVPLKRLQFEQGNATYVFNVSRDDPDTIVLYERRGPLTTYYLADQAGHLRRAVVNDGSIVSGGLTNLTPAEAASGFKKQKRLWLQKLSN